MDRFRDRYGIIIGKPHTFKVVFSYASKSDQEPNVNVLSRRENLITCVKSHVSGANIEFNFWGARHLVNAFRNPPNRTLALDIIHNFMPSDGSVVCLARLDKFAEFLTDENGLLREYLFEPNVRDYQGIGNPVNKDIREALKSSEVREFWWLNNGITILANACQLGAGKVTIEHPELVNGLQTSYEIVNYFSKASYDDARMVLVRVILPPNDQTRRRIIKATNYQTQVSSLSLHAMEDIHFDIEELLKLYDIFYDRRKGEYRRLRKPISKIISIRDLAQTVIAIALQQPDDARARPMNVLARDEGYESVFDVTVSRELFLSCVLLDRQIGTYLSKREDITRDTKNDIHFYMDTLMSANLCGKAQPSKSDIAGLVNILKNPINEDLLKNCCEEITALYEKHGGDDRAAKGKDMVAELRDMLREKFE